MFLGNQVIREGRIIIVDLVAHHVVRRFRDCRGRSCSGHGVLRVGCLESEEGES